MQDCCLYLCDMESHTKYTVTLLLERGGSGAGSHWLVHALAAPDGLPRVGGDSVIAVYCRWPCKAHASFSACLYALLAQVDGEIGRKTFQENLGI